MELRHRILQVKGVISITCDIQTKFVRVLCSQTKSEMFSILKQTVEACIGTGKVEDAKGANVGYDYEPRAKMRDAQHQREASDSQVYFIPPEVGFDAIEYEKKRTAAIARKQESRVGFLDRLISLIR